MHGSIQTESKAKKETIRVMQTLSGKRRPLTLSNRTEDITKK
jgi:hypothetical protein